MKQLLISALPQPLDVATLLSISMNLTSLGNLYTWSQNICINDKKCLLKYVKCFFASTFEEVTYLAFSEIPNQKPIQMSESNQAYCIVKILWR